MNAYIKDFHTDFLKIDTPLKIDLPQSFEGDQLMMEEYLISLIQMMENAERCLAFLTKECFFGGNMDGKNFVVMAGKGGGAFTAEIGLHSWGGKIKVFP